MREVVKCRIELIIDCSTLGFERFLDAFRHFANHGFNHPFAPLLDAHRKFCRRNFSQQVIRQRERNAIAIASGVKDHFTCDNALTNAEMLDGTAKLWDGGISTLVNPDLIGILLSLPRRRFRDGARNDNAIETPVVSRPRTSPG